MSVSMSETVVVILAQNISLMFGFEYKCECVLSFGRFYGPNYKSNV